MVSVLWELRIRGKKLPVTSRPVFRKSTVWGGGKALLVRGPGLGKSVLSGQEPCELCVSIGTQLAFYNDFSSRQKKVC